MRGMLALGLSAALAGCYSVDQVRFSSDVAGVVAAGMPMEEALVRMRTEGFACEPQAAAVVCTRQQKRVMQGPCLERVDLVRGPGKSLGRVETPPIQCKPLTLWGKGQA